MNDDSFYSLDRLVEFGMGMSIAQQMVQTMNTAFANMPQAGALNVSPVQTPPPVYFVMLDDKQVGPLHESEILHLINEKRITKDTYLWHPGLSQWAMAMDLPHILKLVALNPPPFDPQITNV
ncbi:MAG: GYF domain-containing protein [Flavobacteriales bacterium]|jgi:hypothetical protein